MHVCSPHRWQVYSRPVSSITASRAAPFSGRGRRDRRYALVATVDHRDGPEGPGGIPGPSLCGRRIIDPSAHAGQLLADDPGGELARYDVHRLSTGAHNLPVSPLAPPRPPVPVWRLALPHRAATTANFELVKRFRGDPRSSPDLRAS